MELHIDYDKIREVHSYIQEKTAGWMDNLAEIVQIIGEMSVDTAMEGATAEKILSYMTEVHGSMYVLISDIVSDFLTRQMMFEAELYELDKDAYTIIPEDYVNNTISKYSDTYDLFDGYVENLNKILYNIGDVIEPVEPNSENIYTELEEYITREKQKMQQYHELDERFCFNEFSDFEQRIDALTEYISGIRKNYSERKAYISGDIQQMPEYQVCKENLEKHMEYQAENEGAIQAASELYIDVNTMVAADNRAHAGWQKVFTGAGLLWLGGAAIATVVGGPAGASAAATAWGSLIGVSGTVTAGFGLFDTIEGGQDIKYGIKGDIYTESYNPYKDLLGEENYYKAEKMSANITGGLLTVDMVYNIGKGRWWGKSEVEANYEPTKIENTETAKIEATETKIAELNDAKVVELEVRESEFKNFDIKNASKKQKGNFGEYYADNNLKNNKSLKDAGYDLESVGKNAPITPNDKLQKGIDGLYKNNNVNSDIKYVVDEAKFGTSSLSKTSIDGVQMSDDWLIGKYSQNDRILKAVNGDVELANDIKRAFNRGQVEKVLSRVDSQGIVTTYKLDYSGKIIGTWP